jgi:hypothetical protein
LNCLDPNLRFLTGREEQIVATIKMKKHLKNLMLEMTKEDVF